MTWYCHIGSQRGRVPAHVQLTKERRRRGRGHDPTEHKFDLAQSQGHYTTSIDENIASMFGHDTIFS